VADEFASSGFLGGAELNDVVLIEFLKKRHNVMTCASSDFLPIY